MWRFLVGLGLLLVLAGLVVVALGVAIFVSSFGNTLIAAGTICLVGGGTLAAVGLVLRELNSISARLDAVLGSGLRAPVATQQPYYDDAPEDDYRDEPQAEPVYPPEPVHAPEPVQAPIAAPEPVMAPAPRTFSPPPFLRSSFERPAPAPVPPPAPAASVLPELDLDAADDEPVAAPTPAPEPTSRLPEALQRGRILGRISENSPFPVRPRAEPPASPEPEVAPERQPERSLFGTRTFTPPSRRPDPVAPPAAPAAPTYAPPTFTPPNFTPPAPPPALPPAAAAPAGEEPSVLKSGVVGGMAYTLYSDGSIQAELPDGTLRFASLQELRDHVARSAQKPN